MLKWIEATGKNEEAAVSNALDQLGLDRDEVSVEVLERAKSGFLGLGGTPARVKVTYEAPDEAPVREAPPVKQEAPATKEAPAAPPVARQPKPPAAEQKEPTPPRAPVEAAQKPPATGERAGRIEQFLTGLMAHMQVTASPKISGSEEEGYQVVLEGENLNAIIGRRGETLDAIQQLTNYAVNKGQSKRVRIHIDAEQYRARREESLRRLAHKVAAKAVKYRSSVTLEPMNAYERHVIHEALQEFPGVTTYSTGTEPNRRTVVAYGQKEKRG